MKSEESRGFVRGWAKLGFLCLTFCAAVVGFAAESISITATPRYPWNGKVDLKFTIDGTSGTKYDTSFTAKDVAGGTNLTMKTLYKSNGVAANVAKEALLPGTYNWVWDATADLTSRWLSYLSCVPTSSVVLFKDTQLLKIAEFYAVPCGMAVSDKSNRVKGTLIKDDGAGLSVQFAFSDDVYTKCVCVHFEQSGENVVGYAKWARYVSGTGRDGEDFDENSAATQSIATSETASGYGLCKMGARVPESNSPVVLDRVVVDGKTELNEADAKRYMIVNLKSGAVSYMAEAPAGGWSNDPYKQTQMVFQRIEAGQFTQKSGSSSSRTVTITKPFYIALHAFTAYHGSTLGCKVNIECVIGNYNLYRDSVWAKSTKAVPFADPIAGRSAELRLVDSLTGSDWIIGKLNSKTKLSFSVPTEAQLTLARSTMNIGSSYLMTRDYYKADLGGTNVINPCQGRSGATSVKVDPAANYSAVTACVSQSARNWMRLNGDAFDEGTLSGYGSKAYLRPCLEVSK